MSEQGPAQELKWLTPFRILLLLCALTVVIYFDKGAIASNGVNGAQSTAEQSGFGIQGDFNLGLMQDGFLPAALVAGITVSAPVAAQWAKSHNHLRMIGLGMLLWAMGATLCALAPSYATLLAARFIMGLGTGPFIAVSAPLVDDTAPSNRKSLWLSALFLCITLGFASGFTVGGVVGMRYGWRTVMLSEALLMLSFVPILLLSPDVTHRARAAAAAATGGTEGQKVSPWCEAAADLRALLSLPVTCCTILALCLFVGAMGSLSFYGPKAARSILNLTPEVADISFGLANLVAGSLGTLAGGAVLDALGSSLKNALILCTTAVFFGSGLTMSGFTFATTLPTFYASITVGNLLMFSIGAPSLGVLLWSCPPHLRPFVLSASEVAQHVLGDVPTPPLMGALQEWHGSWRLTMTVSIGLVGFSAFLYLAGLAFLPKVRLEAAQSLGLKRNGGMGIAFEEGVKAADDPEDLRLSAPLLP